ncbi:calcium/proton exchanger [Polytolypa hystricis UAMH7299]|uniref:Vacuolar calcium ion transporter n=1 Tax=Polytolypa hystricis (strain UAMH7299) TaxID=1447883 RepID=A0A2B7YFZ6_POLH7|nr:calcium/proton exchanger [Polytolypa hystricis UAMH7299]
MHIYRRQAHSLAWYDGDGEPPSRNPFKKFRSRRARPVESQVEDGLLGSQTESRRLRSPGEPGNSEYEPLPTTAAGSEPQDKNNESVLGGPRTSTEPEVTAPFAVSEDQGERSLPATTMQRRVFGSSYPRTEEDLQSDPEAEDMSKHKQRFTPVGQFKATLFNSWINVLLIAVPVGIAIHYAHVDPVAIFIVNFIAIIPLAAMLSYATEEIALRTGETIGGLLNATFGNAVELIVSILALIKDEIVIVQTSLIGSMLSNLLLVLGMAFFLGGLQRLEQNFNLTVAQTASSMLALAIGSLIIPTAFHAWSDAGEAGIAPLSRGTSIILLFVYGAYLFFQLKSHTEMYNKPSEKTEKRKKKVETGDATKGIAQIGAGLSANAQHVPITIPEEKEEPQLSLWVALFTLTISTALVALCAEAMVGSIDAITTRGHISETFVGLILLPIVGNAAEHATAVTVAMKDKMDLSIGVAVGSSMQIALLIIPLVVVIGWIAGKDEMTLYFDGFQIAVLFVAVLLVNYLIQDGKSHWLEGLLLLKLYIIIAVAAW